MDNADDVDVKLMFQGQIYRSIGESRIGDPEHVRRSGSPLPTQLLCPRRWEDE